MRCASAFASSQMLPWRTTSAPYAFVAATFAGVAFDAMTTTDGIPSSAAASATPCAWLPADEQITPACCCSRASWGSLFDGPRILYEPVRWNSSAFSSTR